MLKIGQNWGKIANYPPNAQQRSAPLLLIEFFGHREFSGDTSNFFAASGNKALKTWNEPLLFARFPHVFLQCFQS